jgi:hypothetical protein
MNIGKIIVWIVVGILVTFDFVDVQAFRGKLRWSVVLFLKP